MLTDPQGLGRDLQACGRRGAVEVVEIEQGEELAIGRSELVQPASDRSPSLLADQCPERVGGPLVGSGLGGHPTQGAVFPAGGPKPLETEVLGSAEDVAGEGVEVLDPLGPERLAHQPECFLGDVFRCRDVADPTDREQPNPFPEAGRELGFETAGSLAGG